MTGYSAARHVKHCKCIENCQFFRHVFKVIPRHVTHSQGVCLGRSGASGVPENMFHC